MAKRRKNLFGGLNDKSGLFPVGKIQYIFNNLLEAVIMKKPESWDARDFNFGGKYYCPICATPEDGTCQVLVDWEIEKWGSCKVLKEEGI